MFVVEVYASVRQFVFIEGNSRREAARVFGLSRQTIARICRFFLPPGYTRSKPKEKPKLGPLMRKRSVTLPFTHIHGQAWSVAGSASPVIG